MVLVGIGLGYGGATVAPMALSKAAPATNVQPSSMPATPDDAVTPGHWACYAGIRFPDVRQARRNAKDWSTGMQTIAKGTPAGTVVALREGGIVCVKN